MLKSGVELVELLYATIDWAVVFMLALKLNQMLKDKKI